MPTFTSSCAYDLTYLYPQLTIAKHLCGTGSIVVSRGLIGYHLRVSASHCICKVLVFGLICDFIVNRDDSLTS